MSDGKTIENGAIDYRVHGREYAEWMELQPDYVYPKETDIPRAQPLKGYIRKNA